jgi:hydroxymethylbilane synthase
LLVVKTEGDRVQDRPLAALAGRGVFVREVEQALLEGSADIAVHSAKDMPSADPEGLVIAAFCERGDPRDVVVSPKYGTFANLPEGATVGTGSARRVALIRSVRPDITCVPVRGNVDTRLRKLDEGEVDALVLAAAGLHRLGRGSVVTDWLEPEFCLPQVGQACVAVQGRSDQPELCRLVYEACDHFPTRREVSCERRFLARIGGGCSAPLAAYAISSDRFLYLFALVASLDGSRVIRTRATGHLTAIEPIADAAFDDLLAQGAGDLMSFAQG